MIVRPSGVLCSQSRKDSHLEESAARTFVKQLVWLLRNIPPTHEATSIRPPPADSFTTQQSATLTCINPGCIPSPKAICREQSLQHGRQQQHQRQPLDPAVYDCEGACDRKGGDVSPRDDCHRQGKSCWKVKPKYHHVQGRHALLEIRPGPRVSGPSLVNRDKHELKVSTPRRVHSASP